MTVGGAADPLATIGRPLDCIANADDAALPVYALRPEGLSAFLEQIPERAASFLRAAGFSAKPGSVALVPGAAGISGAVLGLGTEIGPYPFGALAQALPPGSVWRFAGHLDSADDAVYGFCLGAYRFNALRAADRPAPPRLQPPDGTAQTLTLARIAWLVRDLINMPPNLLGPAALAHIAARLLQDAGAAVELCEGPALQAAYPLVAAVGAGSATPPVVLLAAWTGPTPTPTPNPGANPGASAVPAAAASPGEAAPSAPELPLIALCGKGISFDTGGYDIKPPAGMLRMKKDMAGAAIALGTALLAIEWALPVRLDLRLGCAENSISGQAMRPSDIIRARRGLTVNIGNTDAEGRLVLADLLAAASDCRPDMLLDFATLTGAARVALGPDIITMFCNDDVLAEQIATAARLAHDPAWRMPLHDSYNYLLESPVADLNNVSDKPYAGAVVAALFLQRFVSPGVRWAHFDLYGWNDTTRSGRPEGGEAQGLRMAIGLISRVVTGGMNSPKSY